MCLKQWTADNPLANHPSTTLPRRRGTGSVCDVCDYFWHWGHKGEDRKAKQEQMEKDETERANYLDELDEYIKMKNKESQDTGCLRRVAPKARLGPLTTTNHTKSAELHIAETFNFWRAEIWKKHKDQDLPKKKLQSLVRKGRTYWGIYRHASLDPFPPPEGVWAVTEVDKEGATQNIEIDNSSMALTDDQPQRAWEQAEAGVSLNVGATRKLVDDDASMPDVVRIAPRKVQYDEEDDDFAIMPQMSTLKNHVLVNIQNLLDIILVLQTSL